MSDKYSIVTRTVSTQFVNIPKANGLYQQRLPVVVSTDLQGMRKAKNFTVQLLFTNYTLGDYFFWALVYVPEGLSVNLLLQGQSFQTERPDATTQVVASVAELYQPASHVIDSGIKKMSTSGVKVTSRMARNLNKGDSIQLILGFPHTQLGTMTGLIKYAITLQ